MFLFSICNLVVLLFPSLVLGVTQIIDDADSKKWNFWPNTAQWFSVKSGNDCGGLGKWVECDKVVGAAYGGSFHKVYLTPGSATSSAKGWVVFQGHSIQIYGVRYIGSNVDDTGNATIAFYFTDRIGSYQVANLPTGTLGGPQRTLFFEKVGLSEDKPQTLYWDVALDAAPKGYNPLTSASIVFDYANVTSTKAPKDNTAEIAGGTVGGVVGVFLIGFTIFVLRRRKMSRMQKQLPPVVIESVELPVKP
ncbi:hypothetical protein DL96DRAFT_1723476 [Flagelloscypha sp. PMI_526]|nr:hypothetical protein DL96DRAFT_1723476 [Flagelloscypha sp. PMI_526]